MTERIYAAIDLKSFFASVEAVDRGLDPMDVNLVVADHSRTEKTICLAVSPALKAYGISGRARLFEVVSKMKEVNHRRKAQISGRIFEGESHFQSELEKNKSLRAAYIVAQPRMARYMEYSTKVYEIYLKYVAPEDIHVYSIDEVFIDLTSYLRIYQLSAYELVVKIIKDVYETTGITATAGIGTNLYLCKIAMDIVAKHVEPEANGARVAQLDEISYRRLLWNHLPLGDFWRVGKGYAKKLNENGIYTMGDIARCSIGKKEDYYNADLLYELFGINAELLIDHAWGWEPCTIEEIKSYVPDSNSLGVGQVLQTPYSYAMTKLVVQEMTDLLVLSLVEKQLVTDQMVLTIGYDIENLEDPVKRKNYHGEIGKDPYGRKIPKPAHGTVNLEGYLSSTKKITEAVLGLYEQIIDPNLTVRRINLSANHVIGEHQIPEKNSYEQLELFTDYGILQKKKIQEKETMEKERKMQEAILDIKKKYGKNAILRGMNLEEGATARSKNSQIGGHNAK